ncbi:hypothetical protein C8A00DRAFT_18714 [Chaetomidium leptoderma]|uniref:Uncharacterized protein n=1 Tax=Chaetomidium leptoderma TaxID=669021 RepID=A0AAN6VDZ0_9PEZI|nr:hypothetical protein C8A00DRAFT_18714 [Chaetomidium leptoderma]
MESLKVSVSTSSPNLALPLLATSRSKSPQTCHQTLHYFQSNRSSTPVLVEQPRLDAHTTIKALAHFFRDHSNWTLTPFISFTTSATAVQDLADIRESRHNRGAQHLTAIDPNVRVAAGLPILDFSAKVNYYNIADPYRKSNQYCKDHYLCLWEVSGREIVRQWN